MLTIEIIGLVAAACTTLAFVPQVYKVLQYKSTSDISLTMYIIFLIGLLLWLVYGIYHDSMAIILANSITGLLAIIVMIAKIRYK